MPLDNIRQCIKERDELYLDSTVTDLDGGGRISKLALAEARIAVLEELVAALDERNAIEYQPEFFGSEQEHRKAILEAGGKVLAARAKLESPQ